jgi:hypothetical protein
MSMIPPFVHHKIRIKVIIHHTPRCVPENSEPSDQYEHLRGES